MAEQDDAHRDTIRPRSIEQLSGIAQVPFDARLAIKSYVRSCEMLYQQAKKNHEQAELAYIYLFRAARIIIHDLPSHPDYHQLPPSYQAQLKADGLKYLDALVPIKSKINHQYQQYQQQQQQQQLLHSTPPNNSHTSSPLHTPPQPTTHQQHKSSISDWTLIDSPPVNYEPLLPKQQQQQQHNKLHKNHLSSPITRRSSSSKSSPSTCSDSSTSCLPPPPSALITKHRTVNPLVWPVELGNGLGNRMSVAQPPDHNYNHQLARLSSNSHHHQSPDLLDSPQSPAHHSNTNSNTSKKKALTFSHPSSRSTGFRHLGLYDLQDPPSPSLQPSSSALNRSTSQQQQQTQDRVGSKAKKHTFSWADRFAPPPSNNNNNNIDHHPSSSSSSTAHDNSQSLASSVRSLLRPRRLSWSTPASINKPRRAPSVESWASVQLPSPPPPPADIAVALDPPAHIDSHQQHTQPRSRRGSLGEPSSWRWLKALKSSPSPSTSMSPHHQHTQSNGPLYTDIPPTLSSSHHSTRRRLPSLPSPSPSSSSTAPPVLLDRSNRSADHKVKLRRLICPRDLVGAFVAMAEPQTAQGIELCGLLLGSIMGEELVVNTLLIPRQISTSNTCHTVDEAQTFEVQSRAGLLTLGWIHTHPTQTCFMSSVDLHNHLSYHLMLPESVAIVCSPNKHPSVGVYKLVEPTGVDYLRQCPLDGAFHPHDIDDRLLYTTPSNNEFVFVAADQDGAGELAQLDGHSTGRRRPVGLEFEILDLRHP